MVIKGSARSGAGELASHLLRQDTNETVEVREFHHVAAVTLPEALSELDGMGAGSRSKRTLYHASINTPVHEELTPEQQRIARERLAEELGLKNQPYVMVEHVKHGRQHLHIVWSRIDVETAKAIPDSHNYRKHEIVSRELEQSFGHQPVLGAHVRDKAHEPRPDRGPTWGEQRQAERSGLTLQEAKEQISRLWEHTKNGKEFMAAIAAEGWTVARGDRRDFVLFDHTGEMHSLRLRLDGVRAAQIRERMADVDADQLPTVKEAQQEARERIRSQKPQPAQDTVEILKVPLPESSSIEIVPPAPKRQKPTPVIPQETIPPAEPPHSSRDADRPINRLFVLVFGVVIEAYQRAYDAAYEKLLGKKEEAGDEGKPKRKLEWFQPPPKDAQKPKF